MAGKAENNDQKENQNQEKPVTEINDKKTTETETLETEERNDHQETSGETRKKETGKNAIEEVKARHRDALNAVYVSLVKINRRLVELQKLIEDAQHKKHGSLTLSLCECGRKCLGCPHPTWLKWIDKTQIKRRAPQSGGYKETNPRKLFFAVKTKEPARIIAQSRAVKDHTAAMFVAEAKTLIESRKKIVDRLSLVLRESSKVE